MIWEAASSPNGVTLALFVLVHVNSLWQDATVLLQYRKHTSYTQPFVTTTTASCAGSDGRAVERWTVNRGDGGSIPPTAVSKLRQFRSPHICLCLSERTLKADRLFYLVSMPEEVKVHTHGVNA